MSLSLEGLDSCGMHKLMIIKHSYRCSHRRRNSVPLQWRVLGPDCLHNLLLRRRTSLCHGSQIDSCRLAQTLGTLLIRNLQVPCHITGAAVKSSVTGDREKINHDLRPAIQWTKTTRLWKGNLLDISIIYLAFTLERNRAVHSLLDCH